MTDVPGLKKYRKRVATWPDVDCKVQSRESFKYDVKEDAWQYQIVIV